MSDGEKKTGEMAVCVIPFINKLIIVLNILRKISMFLYEEIVMLL